MTILFWFCFPFTLVGLLLVGSVYVGGEAMTDATRRERAEQVIRYVHKELPDVWLGGRQRDVLVEAIAKALAEAEREAYERAADRIIDTHRMGDRDGWLDLARIMRAQGQEGKP